MTTEQAQQRADLTASQVLTLHAAYQAGQMTQPDFQQAAATAVYAGKVIASRLADVTVSTLSNLPPVGIAPGPQHLERLTEALGAILTDAEAEPALDPAPRLQRLGEAETLLSHRASLHAAIREQGFPEWVRVVEEGACEICARRAGQVQPVEVGFKDHPGCRCTLLPHGKRSQKSSEPREEPLVRITKEIRRVG